MMQLCERRLNSCNYMHTCNHSSMSVCHRGAAGLLSPVGSSYSRRASLEVHADLAKRPVRPPDGSRGRPQIQQHRGLKAPGGSGTLELSQAKQLMKEMWSFVRPQRVQKDPSGLCLAPVSPGILGKRVQLTTNHFAIDIAPAFKAAFRYRISITKQDSAAAAAAAAQQSNQPAANAQVGNTPAVPLLVRQQVMASLAQLQGWRNDSWVYDPSAMLLMSLDKVAVREVVVQADGSGKTSALYQVTVSPSTSPSDDSSTLQQLLLVLKASLVAALAPSGAVQTPGSFLFPPAANPAAPLGPASGRGTAGPGGAPGGSRGGATGGGRGRGARVGSGSSNMGPLQLWDGLRAGIKQGGLFAVQLDVTKAAVLPAGPLSSLVVWPGGPSSPADLCRDKGFLMAAEAAVMGAKVRVDHAPEARRNVWGLDARTPREFKFKEDGKDTTVAEYFQRKYPNLKLRHLDDWPCVYTNKQKTAAVPLEVCRIIQPQPRRSLTDQQTADLIRQAALPPERRLHAIRQLAGQVLVGAKAALMQSWGITIRDVSALKVPGRVLPDAKLQYAKDQCTDANNTGQWRPSPRTTMLRPVELKHWAVVNYASRVNDADVQQFVSKLMQQLRSQGGAALAPSIVDATSSRYTASPQEAIDKAANTAGQSPQLLLIILPRSDSKLYSEVKATATALGIPSQCLIASAAGLGSPTSIKDQYVGNILLKITAKAGGVGWQLPQGPETWAPLLTDKGGLMVLGVDVGHGFAGSTKPSVAGVVGSLDLTCSRYGAAVLEQTARHEIVLGLRKAALQLLRDRQQVTGGVLPGSLLVYRDGVSESHYLAVLQQEVPALRQACMDVGGTDYKPKITFIVVSKSHGTRLFPDPSDPYSSDGRTGNVKPGTVVDTVITAPLRYEYLLCSHAGIQGTNRCARYNVLVDDNDLGPDALQLITQHLASTYCSCTRTISTPAVVRYADKAAGASWAAQHAAQPWVTVQAGSTGVKALEYRMLDVSQKMAGKMWFV